jgi:hypothetical protein
MRKLTFLALLATAIFTLLPQIAHAQCGYPYGVCGQVYIAPQPIYVAQPQPVVVVAEPVAQPAPVVVAPAAVRGTGFGLGLRASVGYAGLDGDGLGLYGAVAVARYQATPRFGVELDVGGLAGGDGDDAVLVPIGLTALVFFNPGRHLQPYLFGGIDMTIIDADCLQGGSSWIFAGGHAGVGLEFLVANHFGLTLDARGTVEGVVHAADYINYGFTINTGFNFYI